MNKFVAFASFTVVTVAAGIAHAEPRSTGYVGLGGRIDGVFAFDTSTTVDGAYRLGTSPWLAHAQFGYGNADDLSEAIGSADEMAFYRGGSRYLSLRAGLERDGCSDSGIVCGFGGVDLGVVSTNATTGPRIDTVSAKYAGAVMAGRFGVDVGSRHLRLRTGLGLDVGAAKRTGGDGDTTKVVSGIDLSAALLVAF